MEEKRESKHIKKISLPSVTLIESGDDRNYIIEAEKPADAHTTMQPNTAENQDFDETAEEMPHMVWCRNFVPGKVPF